MPYVADPADANTPPDAGVPASVTAAELRALKGYVNFHISRFSFDSVNTQTGSYTLLATDNKAVIYMTSAVAATLIIPATLGLGFSCRIVQGGIGAITLTAGVGCTLVSKLTRFRLNDPWSEARLQILVSAAGPTVTAMARGDLVT